MTCERSRRLRRFPSADELSADAELVHPERRISWREIGRVPHVRFRVREMSRLRFQIRERRENVHPIRSESAGLPERFERFERLSVVLKGFPPVVRFL